MNIDKICEQLTIDEKIRLLGGVDVYKRQAQEKAILECVSNGDIHALENTYYSLPTLSLIHILDYLTEVQVIVFC